MGIPIGRLAGAVVVLSGCAALSGLDALGVDDESAPANASDGGPSELLDGAVTSPSPDGASPTDGGVDSGVDAAAGDRDATLDATIDSPATPPKRFCETLSPVPTLCSDFDDGSALSAAWSPMANGSGTTTLDSTVVKSGPGSVLLDVPTGGRAWLEKQLAVQATTELLIAFSVYPTTTDSASDFELGAIRLGNAGGADRYELQLERVNGAINLEEEVPQAGTVPIQTDTPIPGQAIPLDAWSRVEMVITLGPSSSSVRITTNNGTPFTAAVSAHLLNAPPLIQIGYDGPTNVARLRYDDIVVNIK